MHKKFQADDRSYFSLIKKEIHNDLVQANFSSSKISEIDIIVSEITSNLYKHADGGEILMKLYDEGPDSFIELISIDDGPGIADTNKVLFDGYSSSSTLGHGLGSIKRLSDNFDIYSQVGWGTILLSRVYKSAKSATKKLPFVCKGLIVAKKGETVSGDGFICVAKADGFKVLVADGLGHGRDAYFAVEKAKEAFKSCYENSAVAHIKFIHNAIKRTRGIVGTVMLYSTKTKMWNIAGVGNISSRLSGGLTVKNYMSYNGIIGHNIPGSMSDMELPKDTFQQIIACSDGLKSRWDPTKYPSIYKNDPIILATALYKDYTRHSDDSMVVFCKIF